MMLTNNKLELLTKYFNGELSSTEHMEVERWMDASDDHLKQAEELFHLIILDRQLKSYERFDEEKAYERFQAIVQRRAIRTHLRLFLTRAQQVAALLFIPLLFFVYYYATQSKPTEISQFVEMRTELGMVSSFNLPDGTSVWLNAGSYVRYPVRFDSDKRQIELKGQAFFDVTKDTKRPFEVKVAPDYAIEVLGTSFNVTAYADENEIETTLVEGSVCLALGRGANIQQQMLLPNEKAIYSKEKRELSIVPIEAAIETVWREGRIIFKRHPMAHVLKILERRYHVQFDVKSEEVLNSVITGRFHDETLAQVLEYLHLATDIRYKISPATITDEKTLKKRIVEVWK